MWTPFVSVAFPFPIVRWLVGLQLPFGLPLFRIYCAPDVMRDIVSPVWQVCFWLRPGSEIEEGERIFQFYWSWPAPGRVITMEMYEDGIR